MGWLGYHYVSTFIIDNNIIYPTIGLPCMLMIQFDIPLTYQYSISYGAIFIQTKQFTTQKSGSH